VDLWWNRVPRLAAKIPAEPANLGLTSPFPHLPEVWVPAEREWGWTVAPGTPLPDVGALIELIRPFQPAQGPMTAPAGPVRVAGGRQPEAETFQAAASPDEALEAAIQRLAGSGASRNIREAAHGLRVTGYELRLAKSTVPGRRPENYLRFIDPAHAAYAIGYLTPTMFSFGRAADRERLASLPGATLATSSVNFSHVESAQPGLAAARILKEAEKVQDPNQAASVCLDASSATSPQRASFGNVQATASDIDQAITWLMSTEGGHETFTAAMETYNNPLADWAKNGYQGLKTWKSQRPPHKPQIVDYLRQSLVSIQDIAPHNRDADSHS
jgi:hypothetical protein